MPQPGRAQAICDPATLTCMGRGGGVRGGTSAGAGGPCKPLPPTLCSWGQEWRLRWGVRSARPGLWALS